MRKSGDYGPPIFLHFACSIGLSQFSSNLPASLHKRENIEIFLHTDQTNIWLSQLLQFTDLQLNYVNFN